MIDKDYSKKGFQYLYWTYILEKLSHTIEK